MTTYKLAKREYSDIPLADRRDHPYNPSPH